MSTTTAAGPVCWSSSSLRRPAGRVLVTVGTVMGRAGELSTGRAGLGEEFGACRLALWVSQSFMRTATSLVAGLGV